jgi:hypothetical protein
MMRKVLRFLPGLMLVWMLAGACSPPTGLIINPSPVPSATVVVVATTPARPGAQISWRELKVRMQQASLSDSFMTEYGTQRVPSAGHQFVWVQVRLENKSGRALNLPAPEHFSILYASGEYKPVYGHRQGYADYANLGESLFPGQSVDAWLRFDVPASAGLKALWFVFLPESAQVGVSPTSADYPWGGEHPTFVWVCGE